LAVRVMSCVSVCQCLGHRYLSLHIAPNSFTGLQLGGELVIPSNECASAKA